MDYCKKSSYNFKKIINYYAFNSTYNSATAKIAKQELENNWRGKNVELKIDKSLNLGEGYTP